MITKKLANQKSVEVNFDGGTILSFKSTFLKSKKRNNECILSVLGMRNILCEPTEKIIYENVFNFFE